MKRIEFFERLEVVFVAETRHDGSVFEAVL